MLFMKKILVILCLLLSLCGCSKKDEVIDTSSLSIVCPKGAPVLAVYDYIGNDNFTRVSADAISALWTGDNSPDVLVVDITSGIKAISNGADYKLGAVITFGNFYLASTGSDENNVMDEDDKIVLFGNENMLPSKIFHYLFGSEFDSNLIYEADAQTAAGALASAKASQGSDVDYVFLAQPALFASLKKNENASIYLDIQEEYKNKTGQDMIQAAVFINNRVEENIANKFLEELNESIEKGLNDHELIKNGLSVYSEEEALAEYGFNPDVILNVLNMNNALGNNAIGLGYKKAIDIKEDIDSFINVFGSEKTSEEIYIK